MNAISALRADPTHARSNLRHELEACSEPAPTGNGQSGAGCDDPLVYGSVELLDFLPRGEDVELLAELRPLDDTVPKVIASLDVFHQLGSLVGCHLLILSRPCSTPGTRPILCRCSGLYARASSAVGGAHATSIAVGGAGYDLSGGFLDSVDRSGGCFLSPLHGTLAGLPHPLIFAFGLGYCHTK